MALTPALTINSSATPKGKSSQAMTKVTPSAIAASPAVGLPTDADRPSRRAGRQRRHDEHRAQAACGVGGDQRRHHRARLGDEGDRSRAHGEGEHESDDAIGADLVIAHDGKAAFFGVAGEAVGEIGKPVLVQRAGGEDHGNERAKRGERGRAGERMGKPIDGAADGADRGTHDRIGPYRLRRHGYPRQ